MRRKEACDDERYSKKPFSWIAATNWRRVEVVKETQVALMKFAFASILWEEIRGP